MYYLPAEVLEPLPELAVTKAAPKPAVLVDLHDVFSGKQSGRRDKGLTYLVKRKPGLEF